jgi:hypothetical protein
MVLLERARTPITARARDDEDHCGDDASRRVSVSHASHRRVRRILDVSVPDMRVCRNRALTLCLPDLITLRTAGERDDAG